MIAVVRKGLKEKEAHCIRKQNLVLESQACDVSKEHACSQGLCSSTQRSPDAFFLAYVMRGCALPLVLAVSLNPESTAQVMTCTYY